MQVCRALSAAHAVHVIHRDLKPANIMMNDIGRIWVLDFGLARAAGMSGPGGLTMAGAVLGTPAYMSPEQAKGEPLDVRSDLFALGIIFYELLTGELPYVAPDVLTSVRMRTEAPPPSPCKLNPALPRALDRIVLKCLAPDPRKRHQSAAELLTDLMAINGARPRGFTKLLSKVLRRRASAS
jgi:serine/threonine-protein kinase